MHHGWMTHSFCLLAGAGVGGCVLASTIPENAAFMEELLGVRPRRFRPSIPHLVYQYAMYCNYDSPGLDVPNPEVPEDS
jgi:EEF1A lysine methyltransferase 1